MSVKNCIQPFCLFIIIISSIISGCDTQLAGQLAAVTPPATAETSLVTAVETTTPAPDQEAAPIETATPAEIEAATATPLPTETATARPTPTVTPTETAIPTATSTASPTPVRPNVQIDVNLNVRSGPGVDFERVGLLEPNTVVEIIGRNEDGSWWQILYPGDTEKIAWISAGFGVAENTEQVALVEIPATPTASAPTSTPVPPVPEVDFRVVKQRLRSNEENGGWSPNGSVSNCGYGHEIYVQVIDAAGNPLNGVVIGDIYNNPRQITGSKGPGLAQYLLYFNGYNLLVVEDTSAGRPVTSETSHVLSAKDEEIPIPWLIEGNYCVNEAECVERIGKNNLCRGHYSFDVVFQRAW